MIDTRPQQFYAAFDPDVPSPGQLRDIYVDLDEARGGKLTATLVREFQLARPDRPVCKLLSGHKGSGKTTELMHLKQELERDGGFTVIHWRAEESIDLIAVDFPDLLLGLVGKVAQELQLAPYKITLKPGYFATIPERIGAFLKTDVTITESEFAAGIAKITAGLKQSPSVRKLVRESLEPESDTLLSEANRLLAQAKDELKKKGRSGNLLLIIDDLDKGGWERHPTAGMTMGQYLFVNRYAQLTGLDSHVIYTLPLELAYGGIGGSLQTRYGNIPVLPMVEVRKRPPQTAPHKPGIDLMREIVSKRLHLVNILGLDEAFAKGTLDLLIRASGGEPRQLMHLIRDAFVDQGKLPIRKLAAERAITLATRTLRRTMIGEDWNIVRTVEETGTLPVDGESAERVRSLLFNRQVLQYCNGEEWFAPSPLLGEFPATS